MMDKKAQIADTITWMIAFIVIFFIMLLFIAGVSFLIPSINKESIQKVYFEKSNDAIETKNLLDFFEKNKELISAWVDDEKFLTWWDMEGTSSDNQLLSDYPINDDDKNRILEKQKNIKEAFETYFKSNGIEEPFLYIYSGKKRLLIKNDGNGNIIALPPKISKPSEDAMPVNDAEIISFQDANKVTSRFIFLSDNGNFIGVRYYDEK